MLDFEFGTNLFEQVPKSECRWNAECNQINRIKLKVYQRLFLNFTRVIRQIPGQDEMMWCRAEDTRGYDSTQDRGQEVRHGQTAQDDEIKGHQ